MTEMLSNVTLAMAVPSAFSIVLKATLITAVALAGVSLARRVRASVRHLFLAATFGILLVLPIATILLPPVALAIAVAPRHTSPTSQLGQAVASVTGTGLMTREWDRLAQGRPSWSTANLLRVAWVVGAILCLVPLMAALPRLQRARRRGLPWLPGEALVQRLANDAGIRRSVILLLDEDVATPMTWGLLHPAIALPLDAPAWSEGDLHRAIVHELEHVRRVDWPVHVMTRVVCAVYWFHPFVWAAWRRLCLESERACDDAVMGESDGVTYAEQLVALARRVSVGAGRSVLSMSNRSDLSARVAAVLNDQQPRGRVGVTCSTATVTAAVVLLFGISPLAVIRESGQGRTLMTSARALPLAVRDASAAEVPATVSKSPSTRPRTPTKARPQAAPISDAFVTISVKANTSGDARFYPFTMGSDGQFAVTNMPLGLLIRNAYVGSRMEGGPSWLNTERFDIEASAEGHPSTQQMWVMIRKLLVDRFSLIAHAETRVLAGYALVLARTDGTLGPRIQPSACVGRDPAPPGPYDPSQPPPLPCGATRGRPTGRVEARGSTMEAFAFGLTPMMGAKVVDQTGLTGTFDLEFEWPPAPGPPGPAALGVGPATFTALEQQIGLRLDPQTGPVDYLVIDRVERPTEDR